MSGEKNQWEEAWAAAELDPQAAIAEFYAAIGMTQEEHLRRLRAAQERYEKRKRVAEIVAVNVKFYARSGAAFATDAVSAVRCRMRTRKAGKH